MTKTEVDLHSDPPDLVLEEVAKFVSVCGGKWTGSATELAAQVRTGLAPNALGKHLTICANRLLAEYHIRFARRTRHEGREIILAAEPTEAPISEEGQPS